jgi:hypothetical protein
MNVSKSVLRVGALCLATALIVSCGEKTSIVGPTKDPGDIPMTPYNGPVNMTLSIERAGTQRVGNEDVPLVNVIFGGNLSFPIQPPFDWSKERLRKLELYNYSGTQPEKKSIEVNNGRPELNADTSKVLAMRAYGNRLKVSLYLETELMDVNRTPGRKEWHPFEQVMLIQADGVRERIPVTTSPDGHPMLNISLRSNAQVER